VLIAISKLKKLFPRAATMAIDIKMVGIERIISVSRIMIVSNKPPLYPAIAPKMPPITTAIATVTKPMIIDILAPWTSLPRISRP